MPPARNTGFFSSAGLFACLLWSVLAVTVVAPAKAQAFHSSQRSVDIVNGCARLRPDLFSVTVNPAVLGGMRQTRIAVSSEDAWSLPEFTYSRFMTALPVGNGTLGAGIQHSGNNDYQESGMDFGYGLSLGKALIGILMNYRQSDAAGYSPVSSGAAVVGLRLALFPDLLTGFSFSVPFAIRAGKNSADKPAGNYRIEMGFLASAQVTVFAAWAKTDGLAPAAEIGLDYAFADHFFFAAGLQGRTGAPFGKTGWAKGGWRLAVFTAYQAPLGFSPGLSLAWDRPEKPPKAEMKKTEALP